VETNLSERVKIPGRLISVLQSIPFIWYLLFIVLILIFFRAPSFFQPAPLLSFLKRAAPIIVVSLGQAIVILTAEIDLSMGSLITVCAVAAAFVIDNTPGMEWLAFVWIFGIALVVGLINGLVTTRLKVPSFVTTLGMLLILQGAISIVTKGSPKGGITPAFRFFGNGNLGILPVAVIILLVVAVIIIVLMERTTFGRRVYAVGGNKTASYLSGVDPKNVKLMAFMLSALLGAIGAILIAGFSGVSTLTVGKGYEFQAIAATVLGGVALTGGRGKVSNVLVGALTLQALFSLLNFMSLPLSIRDTAEGLIIIAAMAISARRDRLI
jgi:ribose transport system permease protein